MTQLIISRNLDVSVSFNISLFSFQKFTLTYITQLLYQLDFLMAIVLVCNESFSFLMRQSPWLILSFGTSDFALITGLLISCLRFFVSALFCYCCRSFINERVALHGDWMTASFSMLHFIVSSVSSVVFSKVVFGSSDVARKNLHFL